MSNNENAMLNVKTRLSSYLFRWPNVSGCLLALVLIPGTIVIVRACGPDFPNQLLDDRAATLKTLPQASFAYEVGRLVHDDTPSSGVSNALSQRNAALQNIQMAESLYAAAAAAYHAADESKVNDAGETQFQAVLDLPGAASTPSGVKAAYMLGRIHAARSVVSGHDPIRERDSAIKAFQLVRTRVAEGAPDPEGLRAASYGEQARLLLTDGNNLCNWTSFPKNSFCAEAISATSLKLAIALYAHQAAAGSESGTNSLAFIAAWALADQHRIETLIDDPVAQRLLVAYALARLDNVYDPRPNGDTGTETFHNESQDIPGLKMLTGVIRARGIDHVEGTDRLAALAYRAEDYEMARTLIERDHTPLANWVRAKLDVRDGNMDRAAQDYADAVKGFPLMGNTLDKDSSDRLKGEQGVLALSRGEYVQAFAILYSAAHDAGRDSGIGYDAVYVAERVLSTDELKAYVDAHIPATPVPSVRDADRDPPLPDLADTVRALLARRLVREGHVTEAISYFPADNDPRYTTYDDARRRHPQTFRSWAKAYANALHRIQSAWTQSGRAEARFDAATIARSHGMEIMGTEQDPDFAFTAGEFKGGAGRNIEYMASDGTVTVPPTPLSRARRALPGPFVQVSERLRFIVSEASPYKRFHYRYIAVQQAERAADLLPPRSQAFAAVLCTAAGWGTDKTQDLYRRYIQKGAYVPFAENFGKQCAQPDFREAARFPYVQAYRQVRRDIHQKWPMLITAVSALVLALCIVQWRRRSLHG